VPEWTDELPRRSTAFPLIVSAGSGTGKTTVVKRIAELFPDRFQVSISATTRPSRGDEQEGVDYHFVMKNEFRRLIGSGLLYEWASVHGHSYGTPVEEVERGLNSGRIVLLDIDILGGWQIMASVPGAVSVFLLPPSMEELSRRLRLRGTENSKAMALRLERAKEEISRGTATYDYLVVNERLEDCVHMILSIAEAEQGKSWRVQDRGISLLEEIGG